MNFRGHLMWAVMGVAVLGFACSPGLASGEDGYAVKAVNVGGFDASSSPMSIELEELPEAYWTESLAVYSPDGTPVPSQIDDLEGDGQPDELVFLATVQEDAEKRYTFRRGETPKKSGSRLKVKRGRVFQNRYLTVRGGKGDGKIAVRDLASGKLLVEHWGLTRSELQYQGRTVVASGPVRMVFEHRYTIDGSPLDLIERYTLFAGKRRLEHRLIFANSTEKRHPLPEWATQAKKVLEGAQGPLMTKQWPEVEILSVNFYESNRPNMLWVNPETGHGMGLVLKTPYCDWYGPILWKTPVYKSLGGRVTHARPQHDWVVPEADPSEYDGRGHREQRGLIGPLGRFADVSPDLTNQTYKSRWFHNGARPFEVVAGGMHAIDLSLVFYRDPNDPARMIREFENDADGVAGTVHVYASGTSESPLGVARGPEHFVDGFDDPAPRWQTVGQDKLEISDGQARIGAESSGDGIRTFVTRDFLNPAEVRGRVASLGESTALRVSLRDLDPCHGGVL